MASAAPHIRDKNAPLRDLAWQALRRYGDFSPDSVQGDVASMFIEFANQVIDQWNWHPYLDDQEDPVPHYVSADEARDIPDVVILNGLLAFYSLQQRDEMAEPYQGIYFQSLNTEAYKKRFGWRNKRFDMQVIR